MRKVGRGVDRVGNGRKGAAALDEYGRPNGRVDTGQQPEFDLWTGLRRRVRKLGRAVDAMKNGETSHPGAIRA